MHLRVRIRCKIGLCTEGGTEGRREGGTGRKCVYRQSGRVRPLFLIMALGSLGFDALLTEASQRASHELTTSPISVAVVGSVRSARQFLRLRKGALPSPFSSLLHAAALY